MGQTESNDEEGHVINSSTADGSYVNLPKNGFQAELNERRQMAFEKYKQNLEIYLIQQAAKYDMDEYVERCVTTLKEAALQAADENKNSFSLYLEQVMVDIEFASEIRVKELEKKIMDRVAAKFCAETGLKHTKDTFTYHQCFSFVFLGHGILCRVYF